MSDQKRVAVINLNSGLVENVAVIVDGDGSTAPDGFHFVQSDEASIGDSWDGAQIVKAEPIIDAQISADQPARGVEVISDSDRISALEVRISAIEASLSLSNAIK